MTAAELQYMVTCKACAKPARVQPVQHRLSDHAEYHDRAVCAHCGATWDVCCGGDVTVQGKVHASAQGGGA
jgi:hypothetical protein